MMRQTNSGTGSGMCKATFKGLEVQQLEHGVGGGEAASKEA